MKVLVTGANGYIGRYVVHTLLEKGVDVIACDLNTDQVDDRAQKVNFDLFKLSEENLMDLFGYPDCCLHMAWRNGFVHNSQTQLGDLSYHYKFLTKLIDDGLSHISVMGTMHEVGYWEGAVDEDTPCRPTSMYGIAKDTLRRGIEFYCSQNDVIFQWLRCYYIIGDDLHNNSIFCKLLQAADKGEKTFPFTMGKNKYDFISVDALANQIATVVLQSKINGIINCCSGYPISLAERTEQFIQDNNLNITLEYGAYPDRSYDSPCIYGNNLKISQIIGKCKLN